MEVLNAYIRDLLLLHDCVIIPGLGGFVGNYQSARKTEKDYFMPPHKAIAFNPQLKQNDGLLANTIVAIEKVSYEQAMKRIETFVECLKKELKAKGSYTISNVGKLAYSNENRLLFTPDSTTNFLLSPVGMEAFYITPLPKTQIEKVNKKYSTNTTASSFTFPILRKVLVAGVSGFALLSLLLNPGEFQNLTLSSIAPTIHNESIETVTPIPRIVNETISTSVSETEVNTEIEQNINKTTIVKKYHVVVGCFSMKENAEIQKSKLAEQYINVNIFNYKDGLTGVSAGSFETFKEAKTLMDELRNSGNAPSAWILKRILE